MAKDSCIIILDHDVTHDCVGVVRVERCGE